MSHQALCPGGAGASSHLEQSVKLRSARWQAGACHPPSKALSPPS